MSEYERDNVSEKTVDKMRAQARRGMWSGGHTPFGYEYDRGRQQLRRCPNESRIVCRIYQQAAALIPLGEIAARLNADGHRTGERLEKDTERNRHVVGGKPFRTDVLRKLIRSPLYREAVRFREEEFKGQHEALVAPETWDLANAAITEAKRTPKRRLRPQDKYANLLKGVVVCPHCKAPLFSRASGKDHPEGKLYRYYTCAASKASEEGEPCVLGNVAAQPLEDAVVGFLSHPHLVDFAVESLNQESGADLDKRRKLTLELARIESDLAKVQALLQNCLSVLTEEGLEALKPELTDRLKTLQAQKQTHLVRKEICRQQLAAFDEHTFNHMRICHAFERLARLLPVLERERQRQLLSEALESIEVTRLECSRSHKPQEASEQIIKLGFRLRLSRFVDVMEREVVMDDRTFRTPTHGRRLLEIDGQIALGRKGRLKVVAPFEMELGGVAEPTPEIAASVKHPIHRAIRWETELAGGASVRALALKENVSASLVSFHMKLLRLAPEIQEFARGLSTLVEVEFYSLRKLALLSVLDREAQLARFRIWQRRSIADAASCGSNLPSSEDITAPADSVPSE